MYLQALPCRVQKKGENDMYDVYFQYFDGTDYLCQNISKISVPGTNGYKEITGDEIMKQKYRIYKELYLYSEQSVYTVSCSNLKSIEVRKK